MDYKKSYALLRMGIWAGAAITFIGLGLSMKIGLLGSVTAFLGTSAMVIGIVQALIFCKCPKCGRLLKIRGKKPDYCHSCGYKLDL